MTSLVDYRRLGGTINDRTLAGTPEHDGEDNTSSGPNSCYVAGVARTRRSTRDHWTAGTSSSKCHAQSNRGRRDRLQLRGGHKVRGRCRNRGPARSRQPIPESRGALTTRDGHACHRCRSELRRSKGRTARGATRQIHRQSTPGRDRGTRAGLASHRDRAEIRGAGCGTRYRRRADRKGFGINRECELLGAIRTGAVRGVDAQV